MKKTILILGTVLILLLSLASASDCDNVIDGTMVCWDSESGMNANWTGLVSTETYNSMNETNITLFSSANPGIWTGLSNSSDDDFTLEMRFNLTINIGDGFGITGNTHSSRNFIGIKSDADTYIVRHTDNSGANVDVDTGVPVNNGWHHLVINHTNDVFSVWIDGVFNHDYTTTGRLSSQSYSYGTFSIDNLAICSDGLRTSCFTSFIPSVNIVSTSPETNTQFNINTININATLNASTVGLFNCSLYVNGLNNYSWLNQLNTTSFIDTDVTFSGDTNNTYNFNCTDGTTETVSDTKYFYIDFTTPTITTSFINRNINFPYKNLIGQFNFSDSFMLYSFNASIDGVNIDGANNLGTTDYTYNLSYNISSLDVGIHNLTLRVADGHTSKEIPSYNVNDGLFNNFLEFTTPSQDFFSIEKKDKSIFDKFTTTKLKDRYSFSFEPSDDKQTSYTFIVTSSQKINIIETDSKYKNYLISGDNWIDFVELSELNSKVQIKLLSDNVAEVTVTELTPKDKYNFNSIGELNIIEETFTFDVANYTFSYTSPSYEDQTLNYVLSVNAPNVTGITSTFNYNNTEYSLDSIVSGTSYKNMTVTITTPYIPDLYYITPMFWTINNNGVLFNTSVYNQTYNPSELSIIVYNEATGETVNDTTVILSSATTSVTNTTTNGTFYYNNLQSAEYSAKFSASGYSTRTYLVTVGEGTTQHLNAYLTNSTDSTIFTITDFDSGEVLPDVSGIMYKYINGTWSPVESKYSDITGKVQYYYVSGTKYKFYFSKDGFEDNIFYLDPILYNTYDIKLISTTLTNYSQDYDGIAITYNPTMFNNEENTSFSLLIASPSGLLTSYGYNISYPGGSNTVSGSNVLGEQLTTSVNITGASIFDVVTLNYYYITSLSGRREFTVTFPITFENGTTTTFISNLDNTFGLTAFERILIVTVGVVLVVGISALVGGIIPGLFLGLFMFAYCVFIGFLPIWSILPSMLIGLFYLLYKSGG